MMRVTWIAYFLRALFDIIPFCPKLFLAECFVSRE